MELIINATLLLAAIVLWIYGQYWRKKCGKVLCQYAAAYDEREVYGNKKSRDMYFTY